MAQILLKYCFQFLPRTNNRPTVGNTTYIMGKVKVLSKTVSNMGRTTMPQCHMARIINMTLGQNEVHSALILDRQRSGGETDQFSKGILLCPLTPCFLFLFFFFFVFVFARGRGRGRPIYRKSCKPYQTPSGGGYFKPI